MWSPRQRQPHSRRAWCQQTRFGTLLDDGLGLRLRGPRRRQPQVAAQPADRAPDVVDLLLVGAGLVAAKGGRFSSPQLRVQDLVARRFGGFTSPGLDPGAVGHGRTV